MVLYIHEIPFHRYSLWYTGTGHDPQGLLPTTAPGSVESISDGRVMTRARSTVGGRGDARDGRTGPVVVVVVVRTRRHGRERVQGGRRGRVGERKDRTREEEREDTGARRARGRRDRGTRRRAREWAFERGGRTTTDGGV